MDDSLIVRCERLGMRITGQRRTIAGVLEAATDHPDVETLHARAAAIDPGISIATVYRTASDRTSTYGTSEEPAVSGVI
jgi:Fur family transcriptional regulator, ferric uptake regulator